VKENNDDIEKMLEKVFAKHEEDKAKAVEDQPQMVDPKSLDETSKDVKQQNEGIEERFTNLRIEIDDYSTPNVDQSNTKFEDEYENYYLGKFWKRPSF